MGNSLIQKRLKKFEQIKQSLLKLPKSKRNDELKQVNAIIARLKGWDRELENQQLKSQPRNSSPNIGNYKAITDTIKKQTNSSRF